jgi:hypothetical protein
MRAARVRVLNSAGPGLESGATQITRAAVRFWFRRDAGDQNENVGRVGRTRRRQASSSCVTRESILKNLSGCGPAEACVLVE